MMAAVLHVTSGSGLRKFQADGFLFDRVYMGMLFTQFLYNSVQEGTYYILYHQLTLVKKLY